MLTVALLALALLNWLPQLDRVATDRIDSGAKRALASYAAARALDAVVSTVQGTTVALQPFGVGVAPGQVLAPINDLVEHFADLMLLASVSFGIQHVLVAAGGQQAVRLAVTAVLLASAVALWWRRRGKLPSHHPLPRWLRAAVVGALLLRFAVPLTVLGSDLAFQAVLQDDYRSSQRGVQSVAGEIATLGPPATPAAGAEASKIEGTTERLKRWAVNLDVRKYVSEVGASVERAVSHVIRLIVVFLLQTLVLPVALLWLIWQCARLALQAAMRR
ncbi:MAG: hypothetical protein ABIN96_08755 [Rubrivivax sp.]